MVSCGGSKTTIVQFFSHCKVLRDYWVLAGVRGVRDVAFLPESLLDRLIRTDSDVFNFVGSLYSSKGLSDYFDCYLSQLMRLWYLSHRRPAKAQASLRIRAVSQEPSLFANMKYGSWRRVRPKIRHLAPLDGCACAFEEWVHGGWKVPYSHDMAQFLPVIEPETSSTFVNPNRPVHII